MKMSRARGEKPLMYADRLWVMLLGSPLSLSKSSFDTLWKGTRVMRFRMVEILDLPALDLVVPREDLRLGVLENAVEAAQDRHREDDLAESDRR